VRVLVLTQMYPPHHLGGYEGLCRDVVERWCARGHDVEVLTTTFRREGIADEPIGEVPVRRELGFYWREHEILTPPIPSRLRIERANQRALDRALGEFRPDVVSVWHMGAMSFGLLQTITERAIPMVLVVGDEWLEYGPAVDAWTKVFIGRPRLGRLVRKLSGLPTSFVPGPDDLVACFASAWLRRRALDHSPIRLHRATVVYHGIDTETFTAADGDDRAWSWRLLYVGRVEERKGVHVAVQALTELPREATLDVIGPADSRYLERLRRIATRTGVDDRVRFLDAVPRNELVHRYRAADVLVFPVIWEEPFGLVPLEAMACGAPVVATGTGGSGEFLIDGVNCVVVPRGDPIATAAAVQRLAADTALRRSLRTGGRLTVRHLGVDRLADTLQAWNLCATARFRSGVPADPPPLSESIAPSANVPDPDA
jgi:glycogen(starch) synthase